MTLTAEGKRLAAARDGGWRQWGPYLSERQWGTVREDYSDNGDAWNYFTHDQARSRAYRWGEDGLAGVCDDQGLMCFALALWNGSDPILKERLFGLTNTEGNHGEDVKEYYFYVDNVPTHSWMRWRYKYPQTRIPVRRPGRRPTASVGSATRSTSCSTPASSTTAATSTSQVDYAKAGPTDLLARITVHNRGAEAAPIHLLPTLWFRNTWSWGEQSAKPTLRAVDGPVPCVAAQHDRVGDYWLHVRERRRPALLRQRDQHRTPLGSAQRVAVRQGRRRPGRGPRRARRGQLRRAARRSPRTGRPSSPAGGRGRARAAPDDHGAARPPTRSPTSTTC